jgi:hypothetical protein
MRSNSRALTVDGVRARFKEWRRNRQGKSPIPDELWSAAAQLARQDGVSGSLVGPLRPQLFSRGISPNALSLVIRWRSVAEKPSFVTPSAVSASGMKG